MVHKSVYHKQLEHSNYLLLDIFESRSELPLLFPSKSDFDMTINSVASLQFPLSSVYVRFWNPKSFRKFKKSSLTTPSHPKITKKRRGKPSSMKISCWLSFWKEIDCDMIRRTIWNGPKTWQKYCRPKKSTGVCYICHTWFKTCQNRFL